MTANVAKRLGLAQREIVSSSSELCDSYRNVGVEIEVENISPSGLNSELGHLWEITHDGSLRPRNKSAELRSPVPGYSGQRLVDSIDVLSKSRVLMGGSFSWRCATHIHVDMRDKEAPDLSMTMVLYALVEPFIFGWDNSGRQESRFCMPWWVCAADITTASNIITAKHDADFSGYISRFSKYTALNLAPLRRFGTIEYRHAQSTIDRTVLLEYINMCLDISNASTRHPGTTEMDMVLEFMTIGPIDFIYKWFCPIAAGALTRLPIGEQPLTQAVFDRSVSAALTVAELYQHQELSSPPNIDAELLSSIL